MHRLAKRHLVAALAVIVAVSGYLVVREAVAQEVFEKWQPGLPQQHKSKWLVHDLRRPKPPTVTPGEKPSDAPSDAIVLFDGKDLSKWNGNWKVENGYMEVNATGSIRTKESFGDCQLHLEYMSPNPPKLVSQGRGNSGIILIGMYEVQVLDNYDNPTYPDGYIGAVYGQHPPLVNAGKKPGEWQTYDIIFRAPRWKDGKVSEPGRLTVLLNGVLVQHNAEIYGPVRWRAKTNYPDFSQNPEKAPKVGPIVLQDHGDKQTPRFRNIWIRKLDLSPEAIDNRK